MDKRIPKIALTALVGLAPVPGLSLLMNKRVRRTVKRTAGLAFVGAGVLVAVPIALHLLRKTLGEQAQKN